MEQSSSLADWQVSNLLKTQRDRLHLLILTLGIDVKAMDGTIDGIDRSVTALNQSISPLDQQITALNQLIAGLGDGPLDKDLAAERGSMLGERRGLQEERAGLVQERDGLLEKRQQVWELRDLYQGLLGQLPPAEQATKDLSEALSPFPKL